MTSMTTDTSDAFKRNEHKIFRGLHKTPTNVTITLPWPHNSLSPNGRSHWATKARATRAAREYAWATTLEAFYNHRPKWSSVELQWEFHPKTAHRVDGDNAESACKAYRDGIADALGIDDANFTTTKSFGSPVKGGAVIVNIRGVE